MDEVKSEEVVTGSFENKLKESFFGTAVGKTVRKKEAVRSEINTKGVNRRFNGLWDIKFTIGSETFENIVEFLGEIGYDVILKFRKNEMVIYIIDVSTTHVAYINIAKTDFAEYEVVGITEDNEKVVYIDISIVNDLMINKDYPIEIYIDTLSKRELYIVNGKEIVSKRLNSMDDNLSLTLQTYKRADEKIYSLIENNEYQKVVVVHNALKNLLNSIAKKGGKDKDVKFVNVILGLREIDFRIEDDQKNSSILLSGEDVLVYPISEDKIELNIEYFKKFNKLKLSYPVSLYCKGTMPLVFETKLGGGSIKLYFVVAPRVSTE